MTLPLQILDETLARIHLRVFRAGGLAASGEKKDEEEGSIRHPRNERILHAISAWPLAGIGFPSCTDAAFSRLLVPLALSAFSAARKRRHRDHSDPLRS